MKESKIREVVNAILDLWEYERWNPKPFAYRDKITGKLIYRKQDVFNRWDVVAHRRDKKNLNIQYTDYENKAHRLKKIIDSSPQENLEHDECQVWALRDEGTGKARKRYFIVYHMSRIYDHFAKGDKRKQLLFYKYKKIVIKRLKPIDIEIIPYPVKDWDHLDDKEVDEDDKREK